MQGARAEPRRPLADREESRRQAGGAPGCQPGAAEQDRCHPEAATRTERCSGGDALRPQQHATLPTHDRPVLPHSHGMSCYSHSNSTCHRHHLMTPRHIDHFLEAAALSFLNDSFNSDLQGFKRNYI